MWKCSIKELVCPESYLYHYYVASSFMINHQPFQPLTWKRRRTLDNGSAKIGACEIYHKGMNRLNFICINLWTAKIRTLLCYFKSNGASILIAKHITVVGFKYFVRATSASKYLRSSSGNKAQRESILGMHGSLFLVSYSFHIRLALYLSWICVIMLLLGAPLNSS